jgi:hypothetical protein
MEMRDHLFVPSSLLPRKQTSVFSRRAGGPHSPSDLYGEGKFLLPLLGIKLNLLSCPTRLLAAAQDEKSRLLIFDIVVVLTYTAWFNVA